MDRPVDGFATRPITEVEQPELTTSPQTVDLGLKLRA